MDLPDAIKTERLAIADRLEPLTPEQWVAPTCCDQWSVLEVAAHLTQGWNYTTAHGMFQMLKARGDLGKVSAGCLAPLAAAGPEAVLADLRANADNRFKPPGLGFEAPLNDLAMHGRDMFLPLGITYDPPAAVVRNSLEMAVQGGMVKMVSARRHLDGLHVSATDQDWSWGEGDKITGPALPLAHALWGRTESLAELDGPGVAVLQDRLATR